MDSESAFDVAIIGGGPAGLSCALVLGRCRRRVFVCDSGQPRNRHSHSLNCCLAHDKVSPVEFLELARRQLAPLGVTLRPDHATGVERQDGFFRVVLASGERVKSRKLLMATGVVDEPPKLPGIETLYGRSVHHCPYCDAWEYRDAPVAVYGKGEKRARLALLLRNWTQDLVLCTDGPAELTAEQHRRLEDWGIEVAESRIARLNQRNGELQSIAFADGGVLARRALFFNTGQHQRSPLFEALGCAVGADGGIVVDANGKTGVPGLYVAGDASRDVQLVIIAAAEGRAPPLPSIRSCSPRRASLVAMRSLIARISPLVATSSFVAMRWLRALPAARAARGGVGGWSS
jgi:thioredoxin reductase